MVEVQGLPGIQQVAYHVARDEVVPRALGSSSENPFSKIEGKAQLMKDEPIFSSQNLEQNKTNSFNTKEIDVHEQNKQDTLPKTHIPRDLVIFKKDQQIKNDHRVEERVNMSSRKRDLSESMEKRKGLSTQSGVQETLTNVLPQLEKTFGKKVHTITADADFLSLLVGETRRVNNQDEEHNIVSLFFRLLVWLIQMVLTQGFWKGEKLVTQT